MSAARAPHVRDEGKADAMPLLLIHGSLGSLQMWDGWVAELKDRYRLISVDLPGHGLTGAWPRGEYTIDAYADFIEVLADTLHLDRFAIAGHSMGGAVAWTFAATRPERVSQSDPGRLRRAFRARAASCRLPHRGSPAQPRDRRHRHLLQARAAGAARAARGLRRSRRW